MTTQVFKEKNRAFKGGKNQGKDEEEESARFLMYINFEMHAVTLALSGSFSFAFLQYETCVHNSTKRCDSSTSSHQLSFHLELHPPLVSRSVP